MRVLFTAAATPAHFHIQVPVAQALRLAGHDVAFATGPNIVPRIAPLGFPAFPVGRPYAPEADRSAEPGDEVPAVRIWRVWERIYVGPAVAERLADVRAVCARWRPDVIVRENAEFAGCVAAEALGLPHAVVQNGNLAMLGALPRELLRARLDALRAAAELPPDPDLAMPVRYLLLLPVPRSFHDPALPLPPTAHFVRPLAFDRTGDEGLPGWLDALPPRPTVFMTLGTVFTYRVDLFAAVIAALGDEPLNLIVTVGRDQDPAQFGPQPANVRVERYIPESLLLPHCALMVNVAGLNSVRTACEHGVPLVLLPLMAEQAFNGERCAALGMARVLDAATVTPPAGRAAVREVLEDRRYRENAARVRDEVVAMPGPEHVVALLERLASERQPLPAA
ncbi:MAG: glycosyltransferase [Thermomicrobiales bacterium]